MFLDIYFRFIEQRIHYEKIGEDGMTCENTESIYTFTGKNSCDGWKGISLAECKAKCTDNAIPKSQCPRQGVKCGFVRYNPNFGCHLADDSCKPVQGNTRITLHKKLVQRGSDNILVYFSNFYSAVLLLYLTNRVQIGESLQVIKIM